VTYVTIDLVIQMSRADPAGGLDFDIPGVVSLRWDPGSRSVFVVWAGRATPEDFSSLLSAECSALKSYQAANLLADCTRQPPLDQDAQDRADREWLPRARAAGLKRFAIVLPNDRDAAVNVMDRLGRVSREELEVGVFQSVDAAKEWLRR
jgi:hypothetical protein